MWWNVTKDIVSVTVEEGWSKAFCEEVCKADGGVNAFECKEVVFDPFTQNLILKVHVACS